MLEKHLEQLMNALPEINDYIVTKQYLRTIDEDDVTLQYLVNQSYMILLKELKERGILFHCELDEILGNFYDADLLYKLFMMMSPDRLLDFIKIRENKEFLSSLLDSDERERNLIILDLLDYIRTITKDLDVVTLVDYFSDKVTNDDAFIETLLNVLDHELDINLPEITTHDLDDIEALMKDVDASRDTAKRVFDLAILTLELDKTYFDKDLKQYNLDKLAPTKIHQYAWQFTTEDYNKLPEGQRKYYDKLVFEHNSENLHHIEYYDKLPKDHNLTVRHYVNLLANALEEHKSKSKDYVLSVMEEYHVRLMKRHNTNEENIDIVRKIIQGWN